MDNIIIMKFFILFFIIVSYLIYMTALNKLSTNNGYEEYALLSYIPIANMYLLGILSSPIDVFNTELDENKTGFLCTSNYVLFLVISFAPFLKFVYKPVMLLILFFNYEIFSSLFCKFNKKTSKDLALIFTFATAVIQIFLNLLLTVFLSLPKFIAFYIHIISLFMYIVAPSIYIYINRDFKYTK